VDEPRRNDAFDQELRRALAAGGGAVSGPHLDAEVAAAWIEHRLDAPARRAAEAHLADCFDCQAMLATLARISPAEETASGGGLAWWRRLRAGWLVPATVAAAAALVIWVAVPQQRAVSTPADQLQSSVDRGPAEPEPAPEVATEFAPDAARNAETAPRPTAEPEAKAARRTAPEAPTLQKKEADAQPAPSLERRERFADAAALPQPPAATAPAPAPPTTPPPPPAAPEPSKLQETLTVTGQSPARADERENAATTRQQSLRGTLAGAAALRTSSALVIAAPTGARWQRTGGAIEFAPRDNAPFTTATLPVAADVIAAGSAPAGTVCWFVGRGGIVLVSTDGVRFVRLSAPAAVDLVAVAATDARTATVTAADGRRFRTTDAGVNWSPAP